MDDAEVLETIRTAAKRAAAEALKVLEEGTGAKEQGRGSGGDISLLGDLVAEQTAISYLQEKIGSFRVVSEEIGEKTFGGGGSYTFIIDPLDGSRNYKRGAPLFAVSIAVARGETLENVFGGVVYAPLLNLEFYALRDRGAYLNGKKIEAKTSSDGLESKVIAVSSPPKASFLPSIFVSRLATHGVALRMLGSASLELAMLASGSIDAYIDAWGTMRIVDIAAAQLIAREAGAYTLIGGKDGNPPLLSLKERVYILVAASRDLAESIASLYRESFGYDIQDVFKVMK
jgi:myo-inositol-1(or 4)-monophosphatase